MGMYRMPRDSSAVMYQPQMLTPDLLLQPSSSHVSCPSSPGRGTVWNSQSFLPSRASNARVSPGGPSGTSPTVAPSSSRFLKTTGTPFHPTAMSTTPFVPKPSEGLPVAASRAINRAGAFGPPDRNALAVNRMRSGLLRSPGQNATPRPVDSPSILCCQISFPVVASSAVIVLPADTRYITPLTTIGVTSGFDGAAGPPRPRPCPGGGGSTSVRF